MRVPLTVVPRPSPVALGRLLRPGRFVVPLLLLVASACDDLRRFDGEWTGAVSGDPALRKGVPPDAEMRAHVASVSRAGIALTLDVPGGTAPVTFQPIRQAAGDALAELRLPGEPLRSYLGFVQPPDSGPLAGAPLLAVVSVYAEDRLELRLIRGPDEIYAVFALRRRAPP